MFCPRCGRSVNDTANFCGGCGLPKAEIERLAVKNATASQPEISTVDVDDINSTISQLESDLTGLNAVENYTTDSTVNTNKVENDSAYVEIPDEFTIKSDENHVPQLTADYKYTPSFPEDYSNNAYGTQEFEEETVSVHSDVSTVDFIWMLLISGIPVVGFIYLLYTAFAGKNNPTKANWAKATLILHVFAFVLTLIFTLGIMMSTFMFW